MKQQLVTTNKQLEITNKQLGILQEQAESKKEIRKAMKAISKVLGIASNINLEKHDFGVFENVAYLRLLEYLHDSGGKTITWRPHAAFVFGKFFASSLTEWNNFDSFLNIFEKAVTDSGRKLEIGFVSNPKLMATPKSELEEIQVSDYVKDIYSLRIAYDEIASIEKVISVYDRSLLNDIQTIYFKILKTLQERLLSGCEIEISTNMKTRDLPEYLLRFIAYDAWKECIKDLNEHIVPRLNEIQRHLFELV